MRIKEYKFYSYYYYYYYSLSEPRTSILGTKELFIESGSTINLTCVIHTGGQSMDGKHIFWNYDGKVTDSFPSALQH